MVQYKSFKAQISQKQNIIVVRFMMMPCDTIMAAMAATAVAVAAAAPAQEGDEKPQEGSKKARESPKKTQKEPKRAPREPKRAPREQAWAVWGGQGVPPKHAAHAFAREGVQESPKTG